MLESKFQRELREEITGRGGRTFKLSGTAYQVGLPDLLCCIDGKTFFVETKVSPQLKKAVGKMHYLKGVTLLQQTTLIDMVNKGDAKVIIAVQVKRDIAYIYKLVRLTNTIMLDESAIKTMTWLRGRGWNINVILNML